MMSCVVVIVFLFVVVVFPLRAASEVSTELSASTSVVGEDAVLFQDIPSVYGASKYEQKVTEAPSSVTIITNDEIKKYGYRTLADLLQGVNSFFVTNDRNYSYIGARGFNRPGDYNSRMLLLVDGHRLNDNLYDQGAIGREEVVDIDLIEQVEIIRGPSSSLYGTNAFFGVINVITKRGRDINGAEVSAETGSYGSRLGRFTYGKRFQNSLEILVSGAFYDSEGHRRLYFREFDDPTTNNGITKRGDDDRFYKLFAKLSLADFTFQGGYLARNKAVPTAPYGTVFNTTRTTATDEHAYLDLKYQHLFAQLFDLSARLYYDRYYYRGDNLFDYGTADEPQFTFNRDLGVGDWWGSEVTLTKRLWEQHKITAGGEFRQNVRQSQKNFDVAPFASYLDDLRSTRNWALYLQDEFSFFDNFILNVGARYDHYDSFGGTFNPRLALIYNLGKTSIKLLYGEAFRAPTVSEQFYVAGELYKANPKLKPETITSYELVIERYLNEHLRAVLTGYYYTVDHLISQTLDQTDERLFFDNVESLEAKGLELDLEGKWASGIEGRLSYAFQKAMDQATGKALSNSPQHMVKLNLIVPLWRDQVFAGLDTRFMSARKTLSGGRAQSHFVSNMTVVAQNLPRLKGVELSGSLYNLFDEHYGDPGSGEHRQNVIFQDGRTFWLRLKYAF